MKTDSTLQHDVNAELKWCPSVNAAHIGVTAENGVVTLTGQVAHFAEREKAEDAAKAVYGVRGVANDIDVEVVGSSKRSDQDIAEAVLSSLNWSSEVPDGRVKVVTEDGWVTLEGNLDWGFQRLAAVRCVRYLTGVRGVTNAITIKPKAKSTDVTAKIEGAFRRHADLDARRIGVQTKGGKVTLSGHVSSWAERTRAVTAAWAAPGVTNVVNDLVVSP